MSESLFNKVAGLLLKWTPTQVFSCEISEKSFKNTYFEEHLRTTASEKIMIDVISCVYFTDEKHIFDGCSKNFSSLSNFIHLGNLMVKIPRSCLNL